MSDTDDGVTLARAFARRLRANADHAERSKFSPANLSTLPVPDCRALARFLDDACEIAEAEPMAAHLAKPAPDDEPVAWRRLDSCDGTIAYSYSELPHTEPDIGSRCIPRGPSEPMYLRPAPAKPAPEVAELVERLNAGISQYPDADELDQAGCTMSEAAATLTRLSAEVERLREEAKAERDRAKEMHRRAQAAEAPKMSARDIAKTMWGMLWKAYGRYHEERARAEAAEAEAKRLREALARKDRSLLIVKEQLGEGIHTGLRRYCDSRAASQAWAGISQMPPQEWGAVIEAFLEYAEVDAALRKEAGHE